MKLTQRFEEILDKNMMEPDEIEDTLPLLINAVKARDEEVASVFNNSGSAVYKALIKYKMEETL